MGTIKAVGKAAKLGSRTRKAAAPKGGKILKAGDTPTKTKASTKSTKKNKGPITAAREKAKSSEVSIPAPYRTTPVAPRSGVEGEAEFRPPVRRGTSQPSTQRRGTRQGRIEGRTERVVQGETIRDTPSSPPPAQRSAAGSGGGRVRGRHLAAGAGAAAAGAAFLMSDGGEKKAASTSAAPTPAAKKPTQEMAGGSASFSPVSGKPTSNGVQKQPIQNVPQNTPQSAPQSAPRSAPAAPKSAGSKSSGISAKKPMRGEDMADFLGLSKDSAVRFYMREGKHMYPTKGNPPKKVQRKPAGGNK
jgi:hypothetical protein